MAAPGASHEHFEVSQCLHPLPPTAWHCHSVVTPVTGPAYSDDTVCSVRVDAGCLDVARCRWYSRPSARKQNFLCGKGTLPQSCLFLEMEQAEGSPNVPAPQLVPIKDLDRSCHEGDRERSIEPYIVALAASSEWEIAFRSMKGPQTNMQKELKFPGT